MTLVVQHCGNQPESSISWLGFKNYQGALPELISHCHSGTEGEAEAEQADSSAVFFFHIKQLHGSLLSPSEAKSPVHVTPSVLRPSRGSRMSVQVRPAPAPGDLSQKVKSTSSQCPLQEEAQPFSQNFGTFQEDSEQCDGCLSPMACCVPCGDRDTEAHLPIPRGSQGKSHFAP